jgi:hypothetical protein
MDSHPAIRDPLSNNSMQSPALRGAADAKRYAPLVLRMRELIGLEFTW